LFQERGIAPKNKLGQNFLIDLNLIDLAVRAAELSEEDGVLEVGSGTGSLTMRLVESAGAVVSVEVDPPFASLTRELIETHFSIVEGLRKPGGARREDVRLIQGDVLSTKNEVNPDVLHAVQDMLAVPRVKRLKLVANLPYAIAVPLLTNLLLTSLPFERMAAMVQWELAERMTASPGAPAYGALAVLVQSLADVEVVRKVGPSVFFPRPQVDSALVLIRPSAEKRARVGSASRLRCFLRDLYSHRRKNLRGALAALPGQELSKGEVDARLSELGIEGAVRAETLGLEEHLRLLQSFSAEPPS
jgi:16S rRNA (adenine1518-N6/adenine1519-N6)-dimethyltransferase